MTRYHVLIFLLFCLLSAISLSVNSQTTFSLNLGFGISGISGSALKISENGDCLFTAHNFNTLHILKTDSTGNLLYEKGVPNLATNVTRLISDATNGGFLLHNAFLGLPTISLLIDSVGNTVWLKTHTLTSPTIFNDVHELADGSTIFAGQILEPNGVDYDIVLMHLDSLGNHDWTKSISAPGTQSYKSISVTSDGGFVVISTELSIERNLIRFSNSGNVIYAKTYGAGINNGLRIEKFHETLSGRTFLTASYFNQPGLQELRVSLILEIDSVGNIIAQRAYLNSLNHPFFSNNSFLFEDSGGYFNIFSSTHPSNFIPTAFYDVMLSISMNNQLNPYSVRIQSVFYSGITLAAVQQSSPFDYVQVLNIRDHFSYSPQVISKTSFQKLSFSVANTCINFSSTTKIDTTVNIFQPVNCTINLNSHIGTTTQTIPPQSVTPSISIDSCTPTSIEQIKVGINFSVYPNPASTKLFIKSEDENLFGTEYSVFNLLGEEVLNGRILSNNISVEKLPSQNYILQLKMKEQNHYIRFVKN